MNKCVIIGRVTKDIELKQLSSGGSVVEFSVAVKRSFKNANGEYESDFFNCVAFKNTAELISRYVKKGDMIAIVGRLQTRNYTNKEGMLHFSSGYGWRSGVRHQLQYIQP